jgi:hypothetical protein
MPHRITGYHFTGDTLRDGRPIPEVGEWLIHEGEVAPCEVGLHASPHPFDALLYAPGNRLHKVVLRKGLKSHGDPIDKYVGKERKIIASIDAEKLLRDFARWSALKVIHLWDAPDVVKQFLETGDENLRAAARDAAWAAARDALAADAARVAAWAAAWAAGRDAARDAAWAAARAAARDAEWNAAFKKFTNKARKEFKKRVEVAF